MRYFPHSEEILQKKLDVLNLTSIDELFRSIPKAARLKGPLNLPKALDERQLKNLFAPLAAPPAYVSFLGAGAHGHFVPEWVSQQLQRAEWYTSYTPYQPEASQGTLQAIFEFQSMVASLFGLEVANASMYDGATALMEALCVAIRTTRKKTVVLSKTIHPEYRQVVETYFNMAGYKVLQVGFLGDGNTNIEALKDCLKSSQDIAAVAVQSPNFFGNIEKFADIAQLTHDYQALMVGCVTDMSATALVSSFGALGADIAVGEGLGLLGGLSCGGPGVGLFACKKDLIRHMPGRLVGKTTDRFDEPGYVLTLTAREQHIRREKATSNICTNHNLMALAFSMTLSSYGRVGFKNLALINIKKTLSLRKYLQDYGLKPAFNGYHYNETVVKISNQKTLLEKLHKALENRIIAGLPLMKYYPELSGHILIATNENHSEEDIKTLSQILGGVSHEK